MRNDQCRLALRYQLCSLRPSQARKLTSADRTAAKAIRARAARSYFPARSMMAIIARVDVFAGVKPK